MLSLLTSAAGLVTGRSLSDQDWELSNTPSDAFQEHPIVPLHNRHRRSDTQVKMSSDSLNIFGETLETGLDNNTALNYLLRWLLIITYSNRFLNVPHLMTFVDMRAMTVTVSMFL